MRRFPAIKVCGIADAVVAGRAEELGADYLGFIFAARSPRAVTPRKAADIAARLSGKAKRVGVFTDASIGDIADIAGRVRLHVVQLHSTRYGADDVSRLHDAGLEVWMLDQALGDAVLLDGSAAGMSGGTGMRADWRRAAALAAAGTRVVLAGGISAGNAADAAATGCAVLDVNSSLETAPGMKSIRLLEDFFAAMPERSGHESIMRPTGAASP